MKAQILIEEIYSAGARLVIDGPDIIIERTGGPLSDHLIDELRSHKSEVISALRDGGPGQPLDADECSDIISGKERYPYKFVGENVSFLLSGEIVGCLAPPGAKFAQGKILSQQWLGYTKIGNIPEYSLNIRTDDGVVHTRRLVEHYIAAIR